MNQNKLITFKKNYYLAFILFILCYSCNPQKVITTEKQHIYNINDSNIYADVQDAVANSDFSAAKKFPLSASAEKLLEGFELLIDQEPIKAEKILMELWRTDSIYKKSVLDLLYLYYFNHTMWDNFMNLAEMTDSFPSSYESVRDYHNFPKERVIFPFSDSVLIPIKEFNYGDTPIIEVQINGKKKRFIVDTGFTFSAISPEIAKECGISQGISALGIVDANNVTKNNAAIPAYIEELKIGNLIVLNHPIIITDNLRIKFMGITLYKIDGVIGWNLLQKLKVKIDYRNENILFCKSEKKGQNSKMINGIKSPFVTATTTNGNQLLLHFDTGADSFDLSDNAKSKIEQKVSSEKTTWYFGLNSTLREKNGIIKDFGFFIGKHMFTLSKVTVSKTLPSSGSSIQLNGIIGNRPFLNGMISFDYKNGVFEYSESEESP